MTREEAIEELQSYADASWGSLNEAFETAIAALRPVSREQVEKVWRGEWEIREETLITNAQCSKCGTRFQGYYENYPFCPRCGAPLTDEAVDVVMVRLEALPTITPPNEWVSVEDELPARDGVYLVFTTRGSVTTAHFYAEKTFSDGYRKSANWQGNRKVTHWMHLPAPPESRPPNAALLAENERLRAELDKANEDRRGEPDGNQQTDHA